MNNYTLDPIHPVRAEQLRSRGGDLHVADANPGYPCRQCLKDAEVGEKLILVSHDPFDEAVDTAYRSRSPIFLHEEPCTAPTDLHRLPPQLTGRQLSVRAFDRDASMIDATVIDGTDLEACLDQFFATGETTMVHIHNATRGCWATTVRRI